MERGTDIGLSLPIVIPRIRDGTGLSAHCGRRGCSGLLIEVVQLCLPDLISKTCMTSIETKRMMSWWGRSGGKFKVGGVVMLELD